MDHQELTNDDISAEWNELINRYWTLNNCLIFSDVMYNSLDNNEFNIEANKIINEINDSIDAFIEKHQEYEVKRPDKLQLEYN